MRSSIANIFRKVIGSLVITSPKRLRIQASYNSTSTKWFTSFSSAPKSDDMIELVPSHDLIVRECSLEVSMSTGSWLLAEAWCESRKRPCGLRLVLDAGVGSFRWFLSAKTNAWANETGSEQISLVLPLKSAPITLWQPKRNEASEKPPVKKKVFFAISALLLGV